jgi:hypothetical protein
MKNSRLFPTRTFYLANLFLGIAFSLILTQDARCASLTNQLLTVTTEWTQPSVAAGFDPTEPYTPVAHVNGSTYYVWVDSSQRPWVTQVTNGKSVSVPIDASTDYLVQPDGHHRFSLGVDKNGTIHVTGDMHHYSHYTTAVINPYPVRYQKQTLLYWKSNLPRDVTGGFTFAGGYDSKTGTSAPTAMPGSGWMMGRFFTDVNGELYHSSMVNAYESPSTLNAGQMAVGLFKYDATNLTWTAIGGQAVLPVDPYLSDVKNVFYWENAGMGGGWFQNYQARFQFDANNNLHFAVTGNTDSSFAGADRVFYAVSPDAAAYTPGAQITWKKANGTLIPGLPLRGVSSSPNVADVVADSGKASVFGATPGLAIDLNGIPAISVSLNTQASNNWYVWNGSSWTASTSMNSPLPFLAPLFGNRRTENEFLLTSQSPGMLHRTNAFNALRSSYGFPGATGVTNPDEASLRNDGVFYGVAGTGKSGISIVKATFSAAPLPSNWNDVDLTDRVGAYSTQSALLNGVFTLYDFGTGLGVTDDIHFTSVPMNCDGTITARVTQSSIPVPGDPQIGIMMRETASTGSRFVATLGSINSGTYSLNSRSTVGNWPGGPAIKAGTGPYYLKLQRAKNVFTSSVSPDGVKWTQVGQTSLALSPSMSVGLFSNAGQHGYYMQEAKFDNVNIVSSCLTYPASSSFPDSTPTPSPALSPSPTPSPSPGCELIPPSVSISPASTTLNAGDAASFAVQVTNNACVTILYNVFPQLPSGFSLTNTPGGIYIPSNGVGKYTINVSTSGALASGTYAVGAQAVKSGNGAVNANAQSSVVIQSPFKINVSMDQATYVINPLKNYAGTITIQTKSSTGGALAGVSFQGTLTYPNGSKGTATRVTNAAGVATLQMSILKGMQVGTYTYGVTASYKNVTQTSNVSFVVQTSP